MSIDWFNWYCQKIDEDKEWPSYRDQYLCPCCFMPTLGERASFEICSVCFWEDDGQDNDDAEIIRGGPNSDYSLSEARLNFRNYSTMYRPSDKKVFESEMKEKDKITQLYNAYSKAVESGNDDDWNNAISLEKALDR